MLQKSPASRGFFVACCLLAATGAALLAGSAVLIVVRVGLLTGGVVEVTFLGAEVALFLFSIAPLDLGWRAAILNTGLVLSGALGIHALAVFTARKLLIALQSAAACSASSGCERRQDRRKAKGGGYRDRTKDHRGSPWLGA